MAQRQPTTPHAYDPTAFNWQLLNRPEAHRHDALTAPQAMELVADMCQAANINLASRHFLHFQRLTRVRNLSREPGATRWFWRNTSVPDVLLLDMYHGLRTCGQAPNSTLPMLFLEILTAHGYSATISPRVESPPSTPQGNLFKEAT